MAGFRYRIEPLTISELELFADNTNLHRCVLFLCRLSVAGLLNRGFESHPKSVLTHAS